MEVSGWDIGIILDAYLMSTRLASTDEIGRFYYLLDEDQRSIACEISRPGTRFTGGNSLKDQVLGAHALGTYVEKTTSANDQVVHSQ